MKTKLFSTIAFASLILLFAINLSGAKEKKARLKIAADKEVIRKLEYDFAKASLRENYFSNLDQLAQFIKDENFAVSLRGHADSIGQFKANWILSDKRALEVKNYLIERGVKDSRIITTPFGSTKPIATNKTAQGRQKNRRVEIKFVNVD